MQTRPLLVTILVACGASAQAPITQTLPPAATETSSAAATKEPTCEAGMRNSAEVTLRGNEARGMSPEHAAEARKFTMRYLPVAVAACEEDEWSLEMRQCLVDIKVDADQAACEKMITTEQRQSFERRMEAAD